MFTKKMFGSLTPFQHVQGSWWVCKCICGNFTLAEARKLETGLRKSCGCLNGRKTIRERPEALTREEKGFRDLEKRYRNHGPEFSLSTEEFRNLIKSRCFYCGIEPMQTYVMPGKVNNCDVKYTFFYNGIDRKYSNAGYTSENSVPCCFVCNQAKNDTPINVFVDWIKRVSARLDMLQYDKQ